MSTMPDSGDCTGASQERGLDAGEAREVAGVAGGRIGLLSQAATSVLDMGRPASGEIPIRFLAARMGQSRACTLVTEKAASQHGVASAETEHALDGMVPTRCRC